MVECNHPLNGHESEKALGGAEGPGSLHTLVHGVTKCWT